MVVKLKGVKRRADLVDVSDTLYKLIQPEVFSNRRSRGALLQLLELDELLKPASLIKTVESNVLAAITPILENADSTADLLWYDGSSHSAICDAALEAVDSTRHACEERCMYTVNEALVVDDPSMLKAYLYKPVRELVKQAFTSPRVPDRALCTLDELLVDAVYKRIVQLAEFDDDHGSDDDANSDILRRVRQLYEIEDLCYVDQS